MSCAFSQILKKCDLDMFSCDSEPAGQSEGETLKVQKLYTSLEQFTIL